MSWADVLSVMLARGMMCDVRQSAPRGGPLIGAEPRGFPPGEGSLVALRSGCQPQRLDRQLDSGLGTRSTKWYTMDNVNEMKLWDNTPYRIKSVTIWKDWLIDKCDANMMDMILCDYVKEKLILRCQRGRPGVYKLFILDWFTFDNMYVNYVA